VQNPFGQVALITGAASGIGKQLALLLAAEGVSIAAIDLSEPGLIDLANTLKSRKQPVAIAVADVTQAAQLRDQAAGLQAQLGPIDLLIASAGIGAETPANPFDLNSFTSIININLLGVANSIAAVLPGMIERRRGHIVGLSSLASYRGFPRMFGYCASKAGLNALFEGMRVELRSNNISFSTICPGWVRTPMTAQVKATMTRLMEVEDAARLILGAIRRRQTFYAFPSASARRLWLLRMLPTSLSDWLVQRMVMRLTTDTDKSK